MEFLLQIGEQLNVLFRGVIGHGRSGRAQCIVEHIEPASREDVGEAGGLEPEAAHYRSLGQIPE